MEDLPPECVGEIVAYLGPCDLCHLSCVSVRMHSIIEGNQEYFWKLVCENAFGSLFPLASLPLPEGSWVGVAQRTVSFMRNPYHLPRMQPKDGSLICGVGRAEMAVAPPPHFDGTDRPVERVIVVGGAGAVEAVCGFGNGIRFHQKPCAYSFPDCGGSIGRCFFYAYERNGQQFNAELKSLRTITREGALDPGRLLSDQLRPLFELFADGVYFVEYVPNVRSSDSEVLVDWGQCYCSREQAAGWVYPDLTQLHETDSERNPAMVDYYVNAIERGVRPIPIILLADDYDAFIIDGHHKLDAYGAHGPMPAILIHPGKPASEATFEQEREFITATEEQQPG